MAPPKSPASSGSPLPSEGDKAAAEFVAPDTDHIMVAIETDESGKGTCTFGLFPASVVGVTNEDGTGNPDGSVSIAPWPGTTGITGITYVGEPNVKIRLRVYANNQGD